MSWIKNIVLLGVSFGFCFVLLVVGDWFLARIINSGTHEQIVNNHALQIEEIRARDEDIPQREKLISEGFLPIVYPSLMDTLDIQYPLIAGLPLTNTYYCNEGYGLISYRSDRFGFRNDDKIWDNSIKVIMIGDSFVHGACVSDKETLPQKLSKEINSSVLNLGIGGNGPSQYFTYAYLFIPKLKPEIVYLNFYPNDNGSLPKSIIERKYVDQNIKIFSNNNLKLFNLSLFLDEGMQVIDLLRKDQHETYKVEKIGVLQRAFNAFLRHLLLPNILSLIDHGANFKQTKQTIIKTQELCNKFSCKVIVSFVPNSEYFRPDFRADNYADNLILLTSRLGIPFVDGREIINRKKGSQDFAIKGPHLSPIGYEKMAKAISKIKKKK